MTVALINPEPVPVKLRPMVSKPQLHQWLGELEHLQDEAEFYHRLLSIGLPNCSDRKKPLIKKLLEDFSVYKTEILPALIISLNETLSRPLAEKEVAHTVSKKLEQHTENLKKMKSKVFPHLHELQTVTFL